MVLIVSDLNKTQIHIMPNRDSTHHEFEILMRFKFSNLFKPNDYTEDYHIRKPNDKIFLFETENKKYFYVGKRLVSFETRDEIVEFFSNKGFSDIK